MRLGQSGQLHRTQVYAVRKVLAYFALCDVQFGQIEGNGRKFRHIKSLAIAPSVKISNSVLTKNIYCLKNVWVQY